MSLRTKPLDISEHLDSPDAIRAFLQEVLETGDESDFRDMEKIKSTDYA